MNLYEILIDYYYSISPVIRMTKRKFLNMEL